MSPRHPHILLVAPSATGHIVSLYATEVVWEGIKRGWRFSLMVPSNHGGHPAVIQFRTRFPDVPVPMAPCSRTFCEVCRRPLAKQVLSYVTLRRGFSALSPARGLDAVLVLSLDYIDKVWALVGSPFGGLPTAGILTRAQFLHREARSLRSRVRTSLLRHLLARLLRSSSLTALGALDPEVVFTASPTATGPKLVVLPEARPSIVVPQRTKAQERCNVESAENVVALYGSISLRKGLREALDAALYCEGTTLLIAGVQDVEARRFLAGPRAAQLRVQGRLVERPWFHSPEEEADVLAAADWLWLAYPGGYTGPSGVLQLAVATGTPVIATGHGIIGDVTASNGLGLLCDPDNLDDVSRVVLEAESCSASLRATFIEGLNRLSERNSTTFGSEACELVAQCLESPSSR